MKKVLSNIPGMVRIVLAVLLAAVIVFGALVVGELCGCVYTRPQRYYSPDGEYVVAVSYSNIYGTSDGGYSCRLKVTASNRNGVFDVMSVTENYSPVHSWSVKWKDEDTALLSMYYPSGKVLIEFSDEEEPTFTELD